MPLIIIFILGAVIIGAGVMFSPAWPTREPRIGLNATLAIEPLQNLANDPDSRVAAAARHALTLIEP